MPHGHRFFGRFVTFTFLGNNVKHFRSFEIFNLGKNADQIYRIVTIYRPEIAYAQPFENIVIFLCKCSFKAVVKADDHVPFFFINNLSFSEKIVDFMPDFIVSP